MIRLGHGGMILAAVMMLMSLQACARSVPEVRHVVVDAEVTLLVASDASEFKDAVRARVFDHYKPFANVEVVNISRLKTLQAEDYDAVLILDTCLGWSRFNPSMKAFLDSAPEPDHVVLVMTVDDTDWEFTYQGVDAITAASTMADESRLAEDLIRQLDAILQSRSL